MGGRQFGNRKRKSKDKKEQAESKPDTVAIPAGRDGPMYPPTTKPIKPMQPETGRNPTEGNHFNFGDSVGLAALIVTVLSVILTPPLPLKIVLLCLSAIGCFIFLHKSHWTHTWSGLARNSAAGMLLVTLGAVAIPQLISQWRNEHPAQVQSTGKPVPQNDVPRQQESKQLQPKGATIVNRNSPHKQEQLFVDCYSIQGHAAVPPEGVARILDLQEIPESVMKMDHLEEVSGKAGADFAGKDINNFPINVAECHITSYISGPIFNITATPHVIFQEAVQKSANASESGKVTLSRDWPIKIPKIDSGPDHAYVFYVMNESNRFVSLSFPDKVTASGPGTNKQQTLQLIKGKELALMFSPIK